MSLFHSVAVETERVPLCTYTFNLTLTFVVLKRKLRVFVIHFLKDIGCGFKNRVESSLTRGANKQKTMECSLFV